MRLSCALLCFFCEKSWSICELPCAFVCFSIYLLYRIPVFIKYRTIKNRIDGQPPRSFISLYVFHRSRLLFSLTACFQADLSHLSFLSFHLTSQKSGCRRRQLHLRPSKRLLCLPAEENHRPSLKIGTITSALLSSISSEVIGINAFSPRAAQIF